jgi:predicted deacetylase
MSAQYIFRLDDITPTMDWGRFDGVMRLLKKHSVKPLLGIVPDNRDPSLDCQSEHRAFWDEMNSLQERDEIDIAQHGYQHILVPRPNAALLRSRGRHVSEFAGEPYHDQVFKISEGSRILRSHGIETKYWMAPNHSFDNTTLRALVDLGFTAVSDGISLFPYSYSGLVFVPQQTWRPRWMPCGVQTICLHTNTITTAEIQRLRTFLRSPHHVARFSEVANLFSHSAVKSLANMTFQAAYNTTWRLTKKPISRLREGLTPRETGLRLGAKPPQLSRQGN